MLWRRVVVMAVYTILAQDAVHPNPNLGSYVFVVGLAGLVGSHEHVKSVVDGQSVTIVDPRVEMMSGDFVAVVPEKPIVAGSNYPFHVVAGPVGSRVARYSEYGVTGREEVGFEILGGVRPIVRVLHDLMRIWTFRKLWVAHYERHVVAFAGCVGPILKYGNGIHHDGSGSGIVTAARSG